jgi:hypothetical protein
MSIDDEIRRRLQAAADRAGAGVSPGSLAFGARARAGRRPGGRRAGGRPWQLFAGLAVVGLGCGAALGFTVLDGSDDAAAGVGGERYGLYDCPDGAVVGEASPGDRVYVTGRDEEGGWLRIRDPRDSSAERWVPAAAVDADDASRPDTLEVVECAEPIELVAATIAPSDTLPPDTTPQDTTAPTLPPDSPPAVGQPSVNPGAIYGVANCGPTTATLTVNVVGSNRINRVRVSWSYPTEVGGITSGTVDLSVNGTTWSGPITAPINPPADDDGQFVNISITARDVKGRTSVASANNLLVVRYCLE